MCALTHYPEAGVLVVGIAKNGLSTLSAVLRHALGESSKAAAVEAAEAEQRADTARVRELNDAQDDARRQFEQLMDERYDYSAELCKLRWAEQADRIAELEVERENEQLRSMLRARA